MINYIFISFHAVQIYESKETYGQTRGLSNLEMKHVGKLAIIGALLKAVKTGCVRTMQGRTYLNNNNNNLLISSAQVSTIRFSNARDKEQNNLNMCTI